MVGLKHVLVLLLLVALLAIGMRCGASYGHLLFGAAVVAGAIAAICAAYVGVLFLAVSWRPPFPPCRSGKCRRVEDYEYLGRNDAGKKYRCKCGSEYQFLPDGSFVELLGGRDRVPFMRHSRLGRWKSDERAGQ